MRRSSRVTSSSCEPIFFSNTSLHASEAFSTVAVRNSPKRNLTGVECLDERFVITISSNSFCSASEEDDDVKALRLDLDKAGMCFLAYCMRQVSIISDFSSESDPFMARINCLNIGKPRSLSSSNQESSSPFLLLLLPPVWRSSVEAESLTGNLNSVSETMESTHLRVMAKVSARGIKRSQDFNAMMEFLMLLSTEWERKVSVLEMRFSLECCSVISRNSPAQRRGTTLEEDKSILAPKQNFAADSKVSEPPGKSVNTK